MNLFILTKCGCPIWRQYYILLKLVNVYILYSSRFYSTFFIVNQPPENCKQLVNRRHHKLLLLRAERVEKNKGKHLIFKRLPRISLIFSIQGLFLHSSLRSYQWVLNISTLRQAWETFGKHFKHILRILHAYIMSKKVPYNP